MKKTLCSITLCATMMGGAGSVDAYYVDLAGSALNGNTITDYSTIDLLSFDLDFNNAQAVTLNVVKEAGDSDTFSTLFNGLLNNFYGEGFSQFSLTLSGASFTAIGDIEPLFGETVSVINDTPSEVSFVVNGATFDGVVLGDSFLEGAIDWEIDAVSLTAGSSFDLTIAPTAVPLPAAFWMMFSGLACLVSLRAKMAS